MLDLASAGAPDIGGPALKPCGDPYGEDAWRAKEGGPAAGVISGDDGGICGANIGCGRLGVRTGVAGGIIIGRGTLGAEIGGACGRGGGT
jgi:hypothetical protein